MCLGFSEQLQALCCAPCREHLFSLGPSRTNAPIVRRVSNPKCPWLGTSTAYTGKIPSKKSILDVDKTEYLEIFVCLFLNFFTPGRFLSHCFTLTWCPFCFLHIVFVIDRANWETFKAFFHYFYRFGQIHCSNISCRCLLDSLNFSQIPEK